MLPRFSSKLRDGNVSKAYRGTCGPSVVIVGGGGSSVGGGTLRIDATVGQPAGGTALSSEQFSMQIGFWPSVALSPASLANISTRLRVEAGDNVLIGGFIVTGSQPKRVLIGLVEVYALN